MMGSGDLPSGSAPRGCGEDVAFVYFGGEAGWVDADFPRERGEGGCSPCATEEDIHQRQRLPEQPRPQGRGSSTRPSRNPFSFTPRTHAPPADPTPRRPQTWRKQLH